MASLSESLVSEPSFHVLVIGTSEVGKRTLIFKMKRNWPCVCNIVTTKGEKLDSHNLGERDLTAEVFNMSGLLKFSFFDRLTPRDAFLLLYSLVDDESFHAVAAARDHILKEKGLNAPIVLVANKTDIADSVDKTGRVYRDLNISCEWEHGHVDISAKRDVDVLPVLEQIIKRYNRSISEDGCRPKSFFEQKFQCFKQFVFGKKS